MNLTVVLLLGIFLGLLAGGGRAVLRQCPYRLPIVRGTGLVLIAFLPQFLAFSAPVIRDLVTAPIAALALVSSQGLLLGFIWLNRANRAFWLLGAGLAMNLAAILANRGLMPISLQTLQQLAPEIPVTAWKIGARFGTTKDIILAHDQIRLEWLADRFVAPAWFPQRVAFSLGDVLIAVGAFWLFWQAGKCQRQVQL